MSVKPANINWITEVEDPLQIAAFDLVGTLSHPERGTYGNSLRVTLVAAIDGAEPLKIVHTHISPVQ